MNNNGNIVLLLLLLLFHEPVKRYSERIDSFDSLTTAVFSYIQLWCKFSFAMQIFITKIKTSKKKTISLTDISNLVILFYNVEMLAHWNKVNEKQNKWREREKEKKRKNASVRLIHPKWTVRLPVFYYHWFSV